MTTHTHRRIRVATAAALVLGASIAVTGAIPASGAELGTDDFQVSTTAPQPSESRLAYNSTADEFLAVWTSSAASLEPSIYGQRLAGADGAKVGGEFLIADLSPGDPTTGHQEPAVAWNSTDNEYLVVFSGDDTTLGTTTFEIYGQRVSAAGALVGGQTRLSDMGAVDTNGSFDASDPDVAYNSVDNSYLVVWDGDDDTAPLVNGENEIFGQLVNANLAEDGSDLRLSDMGVDGVSSSDARNPAVAFLSGANARYLVVWEGDDDGLTFETHGQLVSTAGADIGVDFLISTAVANDEAYDPDVAADPTNDQFMVVWEDDDGIGNDFEIDGALVSSGGTTSVFAISNTGDATWIVNSPAVAYNATSDLFSVVWAGEHDTLITTVDEHEILHVLIDPATGAAAEPVERISTMGTNGVASSAVTHPDTAAGADGTFMAVWAAENPPTPPAGQSEIWGQLLGQTADLSVTKTLTTATNPGPGDTVTYTIAYANAGPGDATDVSITDTVPAGLDYLSAIPAPTTIVGDLLTWDIATLASGGGANITLDLTVDATATDGQVITNTAAIASTGSTVDTNSANDSGDAAAITVDFPPSVTIDQGAAQADPTMAGPVVFDVVFSETVTGFDSGATDVVLGGTAPGMLSAVIAGAGANYTVTVSGMTGDGTVTATVPAAAAADLAGKLSTASTSTDNEVTLDSVAPTVTVEQAVGQADPTNASPIDFTATFSEDVTGFTAGDVTVGGTAGATTVTVTGGPAVYNIAASGMTGDGTVTASLAAAVATDAAGNDNAASTSTDNEVTYDSTAPTVTINQAAGQADPTNASPIVLDVVFSEPVADFATGDVVFGGTAGPTTAVVAGSGTTYTVSLSGMTGDGTVGAGVPAGVATDAAGNPNAASTSTDNEVTYDATAPIPVITSAEPDPTNTDPFDVSIDFGEVVTGFAVGDITVGNGTATGLTDDGGGAFTATIDATADGQVTVDVAAAVAADTAGTDNTAATQFTIDIDTTNPTVTITTTSADPTNDNPFPISIDFDETVTGFDDTDIAVVNGTVGNFAGSGAGYTADVTPTGDGLVTVDVAADAGFDAAGNGNDAATQLAITYDGTNPDVTIEQGAAQADPTNAAPIVFDVVFTEDVTGFDETDVVIGSTAPGVLTTVVTPLSATDYTVEVSGMTGDGTITASINADAAGDAAGNLNTPSTSADNEVTYDATAPTVTVEQGAAQTDSANAEPVVFDVVFSEPVTDFVDADVALSGTAGATTAVVAGAGDTYTVSVTGMTGNGTVIVDVPAAAAIDAATNPNEASTSVDNVVTYIAGDITPGVNDAPEITAPAAVAAELADAHAFTGADAVSVIDPDALDADIVVTLTADDAETVISVTATPGVTIVGEGTDAVVLTGPQSDINNALAGLTITANNVGDITVTVAADDQGNTDGAALTDSTDIVITVADTTAPTVTVPAGGVTASNDPGEAGAIVTFDVLVDDPGSLPIPVLVELQAAPVLTCTPASGSFFPIGDTTVDCTATDASGNATVESFVVTVTDDEDPVITGATNQTFTLPSDAAAPVTYTSPTATDNSGTATLVCTPASGSTMSTGANTINCTATDPSGNTATVSFTVTVNAAQIPDTGGTLTLVPWALALLALGLFLLGSVGVSRRYGTQS